MVLKIDRQDFMSYLVEDGRPKGMTNEELNENAGILVLAGSETVSFTLTLLDRRVLTSSRLQP